jgi:hypothetical protein
LENMKTDSTEIQYAAQCQFSVTAVSRNQPSLRERKPSRTGRTRDLKKRKA